MAMIKRGGTNVYLVPFGKPLLDSNFGGTNDEKTNIMKGHIYLYKEEE